ncbi:MAG: adenosine deaminase, partial [Lachnospiraceae bacterium]|nr:adenosine deaminase [Lachnospiraceae bacterium]
NSKGFRIFAVVPSLITKQEKKRLTDAKVSVRISTESEGTGIYKSFNYEIFERRPSVVIAFDGNSAAANMIQEAKNGKGKAKILVYRHTKALREKAGSLEGYVSFFDSETPLAKQIPEC